MGTQFEVLNCPVLTSFDATGGGRRFFAVAWPAAFDRRPRPIDAYRVHDAARFCPSRLVRRRRTPSLFVRRTDRDAVDFRVIDGGPHRGKHVFFRHFFSSCWIRRSIVLFRDQSNYAQNFFFPFVPSGLPRHVVCGQFFFAFEPAEYRTGSTTARE